MTQAAGKTKRQKNSMHAFAQRVESADGPAEWCRCTLRPWQKFAEWLINKHVGTYAAAKKRFNCQGQRSGSAWSACFSS